LPTSGRKSRVIACGDDLLSSDFTKFQERNVAKIQKASWMGRWLVGYSGNPDHFVPIRNTLGESVSPLTGNTVVEFEEVVKQLGVAYRKRRMEVIEEEILAPLGFENLRDFRSNGRLELGPEIHTIIVNQVRAYDLGISLVVGGFPRFGQQVLMDISSTETRNRGRLWLAGSCGAVAIGSGYYQAQWHLNATYDRGLPIAGAIYRVMEAKMIAEESAVSIGRETMLMLMDREGNIEQLTRPSIEAFRELWEKRRREVPPELTKTFSFTPLSI
jgi:hypothetical protein